MELQRLTAFSFPPKRSEGDDFASYLGKPDLKRRRKEVSINQSTVSSPELLHRLLALDGVKKDSFFREALETRLTDQIIACFYTENWVRDAFSSIMRQLLETATIYVITFIALTTAIEDLEFMENTEATIIDSKNDKETSLLKELMGSPVGDAHKAVAVSGGISKRSKMKINCHHLPPGTSKKRKSLLMSLCPDLRKTQYNKHERKAANILRDQSNSKKSLDDQKRDFLDAVTEMARAAGHLPTLELH